MPKSQEDIILSQDIFTSLLEKSGKEKYSTGCRIRRNKINILN